MKDYHLVQSIRDEACVTFNKQIVFPRCGRENTAYENLSRCPTLQAAYPNQIA